MQQIIRSESRTGKFPAVIQIFLRSKFQFHFDFIVQTLRRRPAAGDVQRRFHTDRKLAAGQRENTRINAPPEEPRIVKPDRCDVVVVPGDPAGQRAGGAVNIFAEDVYMLDLVRGLRRNAIVNERMFRNQIGISIQKIDLLQMKIIQIAPIRLTTALP